MKKYETCTKCEMKHDLKKACEPTKGTKLEKLVAEGTNAPGSVASTGGPSLASQIGFGKAEKKLDEHMKELEKKELKPGQSYNDIKKAAPKDEPKAPARTRMTKSELKPGMSMNDLRKAESELIKAEQEATDLAKTAREALEAVRAKMKK